MSLGTNARLEIVQSWSPVLGTTWRVELRYHDHQDQIIWLSEGHESEADARKEVRRIARQRTKP